MSQKSKASTRKAKQNEFAVIGLGRFGASLARRLESMGHIVLGIDRDMARVQEISDDITSAVTLDAMNEDALEEVDIASFGTVIVANERIAFSAGVAITACGCSFRFSLANW